MPRTQSAKENNSVPQTSRKSSRVHTSSRRLVESTNNINSVALEKQARKRAILLHAKKRASAKSTHAVVDHAGDSEEVRQLKARVHHAEAERDAALDRIQVTGTSTQQLPPQTEPNFIPGIISRPSNLSHTDVSSLRKHLELEGPRNKSEWLKIRNTVRDTMSAVRLDWGVDWRSQKSRKLAKLYDVVEEAIPSLRRFHNQWAVEYLAKEIFSARKTYQSCKDTPTTYRGKQMAMRRAEKHTTPPVSASPQPEVLPQRQITVTHSGDFSEGSLSRQTPSLAAEQPPSGILPDVPDLSDLTDVSEEESN